MKRRVHVFDPSSGALQAKLENPGKLGPFRFSPDGKRVAMISAADPNDPKEGRLMVAPSAGGKLRDLLPNLPVVFSTAAGWVDAVRWLVRRRRCLVRLWSVFVNLPDRASRAPLRR